MANSLILNLFNLELLVKLSLLNENKKHRLTYSKPDNGTAEESKEIVFNTKINGWKIKYKYGNTVSIFI